MDIYYTPTTILKQPVVVVVHGGAWLFGDKYKARNACVNISMAGYVTCAVNYRLGRLPRGPIRQMLLWTTLGSVIVMWALGVRRLRILLFLGASCVAWLIFYLQQWEDDLNPFQTRDVDRALLWVRQHIASYGGDSDQVFLLGHSAGAHLVALAACHHLAHATPHRSHWIRGVVCVSGVYSHRRLHDVTCGDWLMRAAFGRQDDYAKTFPLDNAHAALPPHLLLNATWDMTLMRHAWDYVARLRRLGVWVDHRTCPGTHFSVMKNWRQGNAYVLRTILTFFRQCCPVPAWWRTSAVRTKSKLEA